MSKKKTTNTAPKPKGALTAVKLIIFLREKEAAKINYAPSLHSDMKTYEIAIEISQSKEWEFLFDSASATTHTPGAINYYDDSSSAPGTGDCFMHIWEVDRWKARPGSKINKIRFSEWHQVEDTDTSNKSNNDNDYIGYLQGYVRRNQHHTTGKISYEFICLDDSNIPSATKDEHCSIKLGYKKRQSDSSFVEQVKKVLISGEVESIWEFGVEPTKSATVAGENDWREKDFPYPTLYIESLKNLIRSQLAEGGLTIAFHTGLLVSDDELSREKFVYYSREVSAQLDMSAQNAMSFLEQLRGRVPQKRAQAGMVALTNSQEKTAWKAVEREYYWQYERIKFIADWKKEPTLNQKNSWKTQYDAWDTSNRTTSRPKLKRMTTPSREQDFSFIDWKSNVTSIFTTSVASGSETNLLSLFKQQFGVTAITMTSTAETNSANVCRDCNMSNIEQKEPAKTKSALGTSTRIFDLYNDREFANNSNELAVEFGFLKGISDNTGKIAVTKGAGIVDDFADIPKYCKDIIKGVKDMYPELFSGGKVAKIYRLIIFSHGDRNWGLKFRPGGGQYKWFKKETLSQGPGTAVINGLAEVLAQNSICTLYACSTGGHGYPPVNKPDFVAQADLKIKEDNKLRKELKQLIVNDLKPQVTRKIITRENLAGLLQLNDAQRKELLNNTKYNSHLDQIKTVPKLRNTVLLSDNQRISLKQDINMYDKLLKEARGFKEDYRKKLLSSGGNPKQISDERKATLLNMPPESYPARFELLSVYGIRNRLGDGSFAEKLRDKLLEKNIKVDVWSHTDAGHTSRNSRLRLFASNEKTYDLIRLVFNTDDYPSKQKVNWWWIRGNNEAPKEHAHTIKKAALCSYDSFINNDGRSFSLNKVVTKLRGFYDGT